MSDSAEKVHWSQAEERGALVGMKILLWIYKLLGEKVFAVFLYPVILYFFIFNRAARTSSLDFLQRVHRAAPEQNHFERVPGLRESFKHLFCFGRALLDKLRSWMGDVSRHQVQFEQRENLLQLLAAKKGGVIVTSHLGNIELGRAIGTRVEKFKMNVLVHTKHAEKFNSLIHSADPNAQVQLIQVTHVGPDTALLLKQKIDQGEFIVIAADRTPIGNENRVSRVPFIGELAGFPQGPFILASIMKCPVYLMICVKQGQQYRMYFETLFDKIVLPRKQRMQALDKIVAVFAQRLEFYAIRYPYQWFNFFDFWR